MAPKNFYSLKTCLLVAVTAFVSLVITHNGAAQDTPLENAIANIAKVGLNGQGHKAAIASIQVLNKQPISALPQILKGMNKSDNKIATNWFRSAIVSIANRSGELPTAEIQAFFDDKSNSHRARLIAFDLLAEKSSDWAKRTIPKLLDDPSLPLRSKAIAKWIAKSKEVDEQESLGYLSVALRQARDVGQLETIVKLLKEKGIEIDVRRQFGFLPSWHLVGSFDNKDEAGFDVAYGPEKQIAKIDLAASYENIDGQKSKWQLHTTNDVNGKVDLNEAIGKVKGATVYAYTVFDAEDDLDAELRLGSSNAHKVWVNGELVVSNEVYHNSFSVDKFSGKIKLKKGDNQILVKICQNEMTQSWAQGWDLLLRICDKTGKAIPQAAPAAPQF